MRSSFFYLSLIFMVTLIYSCAIRIPNSDKKNSDEGVIDISTINKFNKIDEKLITLIKGTSYKKVLGDTESAAVKVKKYNTKRKFQKENVEVSVEEKEIEIKAKKEGVSSITLKQGNRTKNIKIVVTDKNVFYAKEGLFVKFMDTDWENFFDKRYKIYGYKHDKIAIFRPKENGKDGYYSLGDYFPENPKRKMAGLEKDKDYVIMVKAAKGHEDLLAEPVEYKKIWEEDNHNFAIWRPIAPNGYVAMGLVIGDKDKQPDKSVVRCVKADITEQSTRGGWIWDDTDSGAHTDIVLWKSLAPKDPKKTGYFYLSPRTFTGISGKRAIRNRNNLQKGAVTPEMNVFMLEVPVVFKAAGDSSTPSLASYAPPTPDEQDYRVLAKTIGMPFYLVKDDQHNLSWKVNNSPMYRLEWTSSYNMVSDSYFYNKGKTEISKSSSYTYGISKEKSESFTHSVGISTTVNYEGVFASGSTTISYNFEHNSTSSSTTSEEKKEEFQYTVAPNTATVFWNQIYEYNYLAYEPNRKGWINVVQGIQVGKKNFVKTDYPN